VETLFKEILYGFIVAGTQPVDTCSLMIPKFHTMKADTKRLLGTMGNCPLRPNGG